MVKEFDDLNEVFADISNSMAEIRGEVLAARVLAAYGLDALLAKSTDKEAAINELGRKVLVSIDDATIDRPGDQHLLDVQLTTARERAEESIEELRRMHGLRPGPAH